MRVTGFLFAIGLSQLVYGPSTDKHGRKPILYIGAMIMLARTLCCLFAPTILFFNTGRVIQGLGAGCFAATMSTIVRDVTTVEKFTAIWPWMAISYTVLPSIAPMIGGYLNMFGGWQADFIFMLIFQILLLLGLIFIFKETHHYKDLSATKIKRVVGIYRWMLFNKYFLLYTLCAIVGFSGLIFFYTVAPFIFIHEYGYSSVVFGWIAFSLVLFMVMGRLINSFYSSKKFTTDVNILIFTIVSVIGGLICLASFLMPDHAIVLLLVGMMIFCLGTGVTSPNNSTQALNIFQENKGFSGALFGCVYLLSPGVASAISIFFPDSVYSICGFLFVVSILSLLAILVIFYLKKR
ncbi:MFS transporter [Francisellaceae bacterium]|nr:MFS transporter [Francisellaceae bacterium]